jgi:hypothetical protein
VIVALTECSDVVLPQRSRAPLTIRSYRSLCEHQIFPRWGGQRIDRLLPEYLEDGYTEMLAEGLAVSWVRKLHAILSSAYERGNVARNPCKLVEPPRLPPARKKALTAEQARAVLAAIGEWKQWLLAARYMGSQSSPVMHGLFVGAGLFVPKPSS